VVNLNGVGIGDRPWSGARAAAVRDSRNVPTEVLARRGRRARGAGAAVRRPGSTTTATPAPGGRRDRPGGTGFLAEVCRDWEGATKPAAGRGARVVLLRTAPVLSPSGGILGRLRPLFKLALGGRLGRAAVLPVDLPGRQIGAIRFLLATPRSAARSTWPARSWSPTPSSPGALAAAVGRPAPFVAPAFALRAVLGQMAEEMVLTGPRARPARAAGRPGSSSGTPGARGAGRRRRIVSAHDAVVVGAGLAGLRAARLLGRRGLDVVLLEARTGPAGGWSPTGRRLPLRPRVPGAEHVLPGAARRGRPRRARPAPVRVRRGRAVGRRAAARLVNPLRGEHGGSRCGATCPTTLLGAAGTGQAVAWTARVLAAPPARSAGRVDRSAPRSWPRRAGGPGRAAVPGAVPVRGARGGAAGDVAAFVRLVWRSFALGTIAVPGAGMGALPDLLAADLPGRRAAAGHGGARRRGPHRVRTDDGELARGRSSVATDPVTAGELLPGWRTAHAAP
jgi:NAD dependent epimerase/dehydratase family enzyme